MVSMRFVQNECWKFYEMALARIWFIRYDENIKTNFYFCYLIGKEGSVPYAAQSLFRTGAGAGPGSTAGRCSAAHCRAWTETCQRGDHLCSSWYFQNVFLLLLSLERSAGAAGVVLPAAKIAGLRPDAYERPEVELAGRFGNLPAPLLL